jgi:hypothetical protein
MFVHGIRVLAAGEPTAALPGRGLRRTGHTADGRATGSTRTVCCTPRDLVRSMPSTVSDLAEFNAAYEEFFTAPYPVRTTVGSQLANILVEIDVVAALPQA